MEQRHDIRLRVQFPVSFSCDRMKGEGKVLNVSTGGWLVTSMQPIPPGKPLLLQVSLPDGGKPMEVEVATVQWSGNSTFGLKNLIMGQGEWKRLRRFVVDNFQHSDPATATMP